MSTLRSKLYLLVAGIYHIVYPPSFLSHREVVSQMNKEWQILSKKFSQVCQEKTQLSEQVNNLSRTLVEAQQQTEKLLLQNRALSTKLTEEVLALSRMVEENGEEDDEEEVFQVDRNDNEHVTPMKVSGLIVL